MWTILGAGAIGSLLACQLSDADIPVNLALRPPADQQPLPRHQHLHLIQGDQTRDFQLPVLQAREPVNRLILTTKTYQSQAALEGIHPQLQENAVILVIQNGMGTIDWLKSRYPRATVLAGTTTHGVYRGKQREKQRAKQQPDPVTVVHAGQGDTWIGAVSATDEAVTRDLTTHWQAQGMAVQYDANISRRLWIKLGINCAINPLTVLFDCRNGDLLDKPEALSTMKAVSAEFSQVYEKTFGDPPAEDMFATAQAVASRTAANISSMRQDVLNGNPTEIDAINGYLVARASALGVPCPVNESLLRRLTT